MEGIARAGGGVVEGCSRLGGVNRCRTLEFTVRSGYTSGVPSQRLAATDVGNSTVAELSYLEIRRKAGDAVTETQAPSRFTFRLRALFIVTLLVAIPLAGYVMWRRTNDRFFHDMLVGDTGPVNKLEDWPRPLLELVEEFEKADVDAGTVQVYCLCQGFDLEYVWRMDGDSRLLKLLKDRWQLTQVDGPDAYFVKGYSRISGVAAPAWWMPQQDDRTTFYVCPQELAGEKGDRFRVAFDPSNEAIFVYYWSNF